MCLGIPGSIIDETHPIAACVGDWVLVHVGFAMSRINEEEARLTLEVLEQLGEAQAELASIRAAQAI
jgi:hydrogenase expression/formation protein HypC